MPRIHFVDTGETANDITSSKLQSYLCASPNCVILPGRYNILKARFNEMKIYPCRGSGFMFGGALGALPIFRQPICIEDLTVEGPYSGDGLIRLGCGNSSRFEDRDITAAEVQEAVKGSKFFVKSLICGLDPATTLQDLKTLSILMGMKMTAEGMLVSYTNYATFQDLLEDLKTIQERYSEEAWIQACPLDQQHFASMDKAKAIRNRIPTVVRELHMKIAGHLLQFSPRTSICLKAGLPMKKIEDALYTNLQEGNFTYLPACYQ
jgi:hypothetical protein